VTAQRANEQRLRQQTAELRRSNTELEHFASVASHDLQEPLRKVSAFGELVLRDYDDALDARGSGMVNTMVDAAQRMQQLIHDLLQYSRSSHVPLKLERIAIDALMGEVVEHLEYAIRDSGGHLEWPEDAHVMGDRVLLRQLFVNLVGNALKYRAEERAPHIIIAIDDAGADCDLTITDNGIGFAPDHAKRIFEVFRRLHSRDAYPGTGVGLALCHRIVERHGGMIRGEGRPGEGACFTISLPKRPVDRYSLMTGGDD
jgi:light-regulated signal transduction histidine kinase (bacteriophytochrome)